MIYTVTLNPSLDYVISVDGFKSGAVNRAHEARLNVGGKGINVSAALKSLGFESLATGFIAGFTGGAIESGVREMGIAADFIRLPAGLSRINVKLNTGEETEINAAGPEITPDAAEELLSKLDHLLRKDDLLVLAGSLPPGLPTDFYQTILRRLRKRNILSVVDTSDSAFLDTLTERPFLIKPNESELGALFNKELETKEEIISCAGNLRTRGAHNVLVSRAEKGALLLAQDGGVYEIGAAPGKAVNSVGAGDAMVAGFIAGWLRTKNYREALKLGTAAGGATAFSRGIATGKEIERIFAQIEKP